MTETALVVLNNGWKYVGNLWPFVTVRKGFLGFEWKSERERTYTIRHKAQSGTKAKVVTKNEEPNTLSSPID